MAGRAIGADAAAMLSRGHCAMRPDGLITTLAAGSASTRSTCSSSAAQRGAPDWGRREVSSGNRGKGPRIKLERRALLGEARELNPHIPSYLTGRKKLPIKRPA